MITHHVLFPSQDHVVYKSYGGVVLEEEEGQNIAKLLGNKKVRDYVDRLILYPRLTNALSPIGCYLAGSYDVVHAHYSNPF